jgi:alpha-beta hydrolase superfamily lysophospholipase
MNRSLTIVFSVILVALAAACGSSTDGPPDSVTLVPPDADVLSVGIVVPGESQVLKGWLYGDENDTLVILSHMRPNDQRAWEPFAIELADNGYAALTFDFRGHGISDGDKDFDKLDEDLAAAISFMRARGVPEGANRPVFLVGASMGGTTSLVVAAEAGVDGVVSISAPARFQGQNAVDAISRIVAPTLLLAAEDDTAAVVSLDELEAAAGSSTSTTYTGGDHGTALFEGEQATLVQDEILQFLDEHSN